MNEEFEKILSNIEKELILNLIDVVFDAGKLWIEVGLMLENKKISHEEGMRLKNYIFMCLHNTKNLITQNIDMHNVVLQNKGN